ncbi:MFS general substrate transporter [Apiospora phragmitis]|uniref:MFS general substrate transporter n=1 Tax=Apiospora phragmitis TaxID=2905665 RepID=A0ABR1T4R6_9PEZI
MPAITTTEDGAMQASDDASVTKSSMAGGDKVADAESAHGGGDVDIGETAKVVDAQAERALCHKFDFRLLPVLAVMYLFNALDKGNLGNAQTDGMSENLGFAPGQYNLILAIFFVPYVIFAPPLAMVGKKFGPARVLPILMCSFGCMTLLTAAAKNFSGIFALRWFLGMSESAFFPLVIYYLTTFYRRGELARRLALFYAASNFASAFSGLLAFGVFQIHSHLIDYPWRWLFIVEGQLLERRREGAGVSPHPGRQFVGGEREVQPERVLKVFRRPTTYGFLLIEICLGVPLQAVNLFLPQIVQRLKYDNVKTNLYTVAPNITGAVMLLLLAFSSDLTRIRFPFIALGFAFTFIGFVIYATIQDVTAQIQVAYFATFMMCWGTSAPSVILSTWYNNNVAHEGERLTLTNVFQTKDAPKYEPALITTAIFGAVGCLGAVCLGAFMMFDNKRRNRQQGVNLTARDVPTLKLRDGPRVPEFRWFL